MPKRDDYRVSGDRIQKRVGNLWIDIMRSYEQSVINRYFGGVDPRGTSKSSTTAPKPAPAPTISAAEQARRARQAQMDSFRGWDNLPEARELQRKSWAIYVDTGRWDTPKQLEYNKQAQAIRNAANPTYDDRYQFGPASQAEANRIALPPVASGLGPIASAGTGLVSSGMIVILGALLLLRR